MEHKHIPESNEPVSDEEVRALIERFGEKQSMSSSQPTVQDVAETLQIEPKTVASMLSEIRSSKDKDEIKQRLDRLEKENAELRSRTGLLPDTTSPEFHVRQRIAVGVAGLVAVFVALITMGRLGGSLEVILVTSFLMAVVGAFVIFASIKKNRG